MPRPVQLRPNYRSDSAYLLRLVAAVAKDDRQTEAWRAETERMTRELAMRLLQADLDVQQAQATRSQGGAKKK